MPECQMCGKPFSGRHDKKYCNAMCLKMFNSIKSQRLYADVITLLLERGNHGAMIQAHGITMLLQYNWLVNPVGDVYRLSKQGYRAIEMMYGDSIGEAS